MSTLATIFGWRRLAFGLGVPAAFGYVIGQGWKTGVWSAMACCMGLGLVGVLVFGVFEHWPKELPEWFARWVLQVVMVAVAMPLTTYAMWALNTAPGAPSFWDDKSRRDGFLLVTFLGVLLAPWAALGALVRQKDALARTQALEFGLERSELERRALDARLHLLQAQVAPHFLFNTLANVQALVEGGSPQASAVLRSLIAYLRAAVPRLEASVTTLEHELQLVQAYLELMHLRMPDRLQFALHVDERARALRCPPITLLTLVENAVRHGIDPSEEGGRIDVDVRRDGERCLVRVSDTGVGLDQASRGLGTGLSTLRERLQLVFGGDAHLRLNAREPHGVCAELDFPAQGAAT